MSTLPKSTPSETLTTTALPRIAIQFCTQCKWMLRAAYVSLKLEVLVTFLCKAKEKCVVHVLWEDIKRASVDCLSIFYYSSISCATAPLCVFFWSEMLCDTTDNCATRTLVLFYLPMFMVSNTGVVLLTIHSPFFLRFAPIY